VDVRALLAATREGTFEVAYCVPYRRASFRWQGFRVIEGFAPRARPEHEYATPTLWNPELRGIQDPYGFRKRISFLRHNASELLDKACVTWIQKAAHVLQHEVERLDLGNQTRELEQELIAIVGRVHCPADGKALARRTSEQHIYATDRNLARGEDLIPAQPRDVSAQRRDIGEVAAVRLESAFTRVHCARNADPCLSKSQRHTASTTEKLQADRVRPHLLAPHGTILAN
jgi:hypothetical protein